MKKPVHLTLVISILLLVFSIAACKKSNETDAVSPEPIHTIGETYQGGIIAYILQPGDTGYDANKQHGLIAAPADQNNGELIIWGSNGSVGVTSTAIGLGRRTPIRS